MSDEQLQLLRTAQVHQGAGRMREAEALLRQLLIGNPKNPEMLAEIHSNLGFLCGISDRRPETLAHLQKAAQLKPADPVIQCNLASALELSGRMEDAVSALGRAVQLKPDLWPAHNNLGNILRSLGRLTEATDAFRRALAIKPDHAEAHNNLAGALKDQGLIAEALDEYRLALELKPDYARAHSNLLLALHYQEQDPKAVLAEHLNWARRHAEPLAHQIRPHDNEPSPDRKLRIGYISPDFRRHSVGYFIEPLLTYHDHEKFEVHCFADEIWSDATTGRFGRFADQWNNIRGRSDDDVAKLVRDHGIDILIDLAGHTGQSRLLVFARKPAPLQASYLGYPDTTGLSAIDYRITDALADPPGMTDDFYTERLVRVPRCAWCYQAPSPAPEVVPLPAAQSGHIIFGCFNILPKITARMMELWSRVLTSVPASTLLLKNRSLGDRSVADRLRQEFSAHGVSEDRLELRGNEPSYQDHLKLYDRLDIVFDPFPYHGTTTTCEALWMGVPVVSLAGKAHCSRVGVSLLSAIGLEELVAHSADDYVRIAVELAGDLSRLADLRSGMRDRMARSPLCDGKGFTRSLEEAYRQMWRSWCSKGRQHAISG
jgi:protein O-GlcNAc transferase